MVQRRMIRKNNRIRMVLEHLKKQDEIRKNIGIGKGKTEKIEIAEIANQKNPIQENQMQNEKSAESAERGEKYALLVSVGNYQKQNLVDLVTWKSDLDLIQRGLTQGLKLKEENLRVLGSEGCVSEIGRAHV